MVNRRKRDSCAGCLFFRQSGTDAGKAAEMIEPKRKRKWASEVIHLKVGSLVSVGTLEYGGRVIEQPIITHSTYLSQENGLQKNLAERNKNDICTFAIAGNR